MSCVHIVVWSLRFVVFQRIEKQAETETWFLERKKGKQSGWWGWGEGSVASAPMFEFYDHMMSMWIVSHMVCHHPLFPYLTPCTTLWIYIILIIQSLHAGNSRVNLGTKFLMFAPRIHVWLRFLLFGGVQTWEWISPFPHLLHHQTVEEWCGSMTHGWCQW